MCTAGIKAYEIAYDLAWANEPRPPTPEHRVVRDEVAQQAVEQEEPAQYP